MIISAPRQGISQSPNVGFGHIRNLDITSIPGIVALNNILAKKSSTTVTETINWAIRHPVTTTEVYALGNTGKVYKSLDSGATWAVLVGSSTTNAHGNGMVIWKNYLFVVRDTLIDVCGDGTSTGILAANWTLGWKTIDSDVLWHPLLVSKNDNKIYGGAGRFVFSIDENAAPFVPATAGSYTFTAQALDLPSPYRIKCIEELGNNLMLGTWQGTNLYDIRIADIFPWDRSSVSFGQPVSIDDYGVHAMKNTGTSLVVLAGISGTIRRCDGVSSYIIAQIPTDIRGGLYIEFYPGSICNYKSKIFFGTGNPTSTVLANQGIYSIYETGKGNALTLEHTNSLLTDGSVASVKITALLPITQDTLLSGFQSSTTFGLDLTTATSYAYGTDYSGYFETPLYTVGGSISLFKFKSIEFQLVRPLRTGEGIKIEFRTNLTASYTTLNTYDFTTWADIVSKNSIIPLVTPNDIPACEEIQLRISLLGSTTSPEVKSITIK